MDMLKRTPAGALRSTGKQYHTSYAGTFSAAIQKFHREGLDLAEAALSLPVEVRDFSSIVVEADPARLEEARGMIRAFRLKLAAFLSSGPAPSEVYRMCVQLFPLTVRGGK
jgi:uncharacterized protein (TIGR02147 family)